MRTYVQYSGSNTIHIVRATSPNGTYHTQCGKWYIPSMTFETDLRGEREYDVVCGECRRLAAAAIGKKVYRQPALRRGVSKAKRYKMRKEVQAAKERQRLEAWNKAAQEATR